MEKPFPVKIHTVITETRGGTNLLALGKTMTDASRRERSRDARDTLGMDRPLVHLRLVFTSDRVVIKSVERYDLVKIKPTESEAIPLIPILIPISLITPSLTIS